MSLIHIALFGFQVLNTSALLFLSIYIVITLSDLDCDYLNPTQCCGKLNKWIIPEVISFGINFLIIFLANRWVLILINSPMFAYIIYAFFIAIPNGSMGFYDPLEIYHRVLIVLKTTKFTSINIYDSISTLIFDNNLNHLYV
ncbi:Protein cornichon 4, partial [Blomia tropicalis]